MRTARPVLWDRPGVNQEGSFGESRWWPFRCSSCRTSLGKVSVSRGRITVGFVYDTKFDKAGDAPGSGDPGLVRVRALDDGEVPYFGRPTKSRGRRVVDGAIRLAPTSTDTGYLDLRLSDYSNFDMPSVFDAPCPKCGLRQRVDSSLRPQA